MKKLTDARKFILASGLGVKAKDLLTFAEKGTVVSYPGDDHHNQNFQINYIAHLILTDFAGEPQDLLFIMTRWVTENCPDHTSETLQFHVDIISTKAADVSIKIELRETVAVEPVEGGTNLAHQPDADMRDIDMSTIFPGLS
ncbi:hypothetical protein TH9_05740 [Thalassospira xiamenensis]|uniref:phage tail protein n=1 Tax=Thalassospira xiamenensis TaxID=220697 RepID=UPI000E0121CF|nr:phage tail protein [Thalassospira xiamenensis]RCK36144.1 hypothetical protein TH9_05740 [Thalassospira xiamenensis]